MDELDFIFGTKKRIRQGYPSNSLGMLPRPPYSPPIRSTPPQKSNVPIPKTPFDSINYIKPTILGDPYSQPKSTLPTQKSNVPIPKTPLEQLGVYNQPPTQKQTMQHTMGKNPPTLNMIVNPPVYSPAWKAQIHTMLAKTNTPENRAAAEQVAAATAAGTTTTVRIKTA